MLEPALLRQVSGVKVAFPVAVDPARAADVNAARGRRDGNYFRLHRSLANTRRLRRVALFPLSSRVALGLIGTATAAVAVAQASQQPASNTTAARGEKPWVAPGTPGSPIDGEFFHAQVLMSEHGFSPGVIDGKEGESFKLALRSFQRARGLDASGELDNETRRALLQANRPSTVMVRLGPDDVRSQYVYPFPQDPEKQAELKFLGYRNMLEKVAERYHTTPDTIVALNGPDKLIGNGQVLRLPNVVPTSREYSGVQGNGATALNALNVDGNQPQGDYVVVDKSEGVLKVYRGSPPGESDGDDTQGGQL